MQGTLSSALTFWMKVVFPILWITLFGVGTLVVFNVAAGAEDNAAVEPLHKIKWVYLAVLIFGSTLIYWFCIRLKRVRINGAVLYISNYLKEICVPLLNVEDVQENRWVNIHPVTIYFRRGTEFGESIVFMPKTRWFALWSSHPVVEEIRQAARTSGGLGPDYSSHGTGKLL